MFELHQLPERVFCYALKQHLLGSLQRSFHFFVGLHLT
jgi:hypothetical protein